MSATKRHSGFTLIELMLVIVVLALISVYAIKTLRTMSGATVVQKAAQEASNIQQAAMAYYVTYTEWPLSLQTLVDKSYLPKTVGGADPRCSPFVTTGKTTNCGSFAEYTTTTTDKKAPYFTLSLNTPSNDTALAMAAKLPSAWVGGTNNATIFSAIPVPGQISNITEFFKDKGWVVSAGFVATPTNAPKPSSIKIYLPRCPKGYEGHYVVTPKFFTTAEHAYTGLGTTNEVQGKDEKGDKITLRVPDFESNTNYRDQYIYVTGSRVFKDSTYGLYTMEPYMDFQASQPVNMPNKMNQYYYVTMCLPTGYWSSAANVPAGTSITADDTQTTDDTQFWGPYLRSNQTDLKCKNGGCTTRTDVNTSVVVPQDLYWQCGNKDCLSTPQ